MNLNVLTKQAQKLLKLKYPVALKTKDLLQNAKDFHKTVFQMKKVKAAAKKAPPAMKVDEAAFKKFKKLQEAYQKDDGKPIFLKNGVGDLYLYRFTWVLVALGLVQMGIFLVQAALK